jgi:hypothetical protein
MLVGTWTMVERSSTQTVYGEETFFPDATYKGFVRVESAGSSNMMEFGGRWRIEGKELVWIHTRSNAPSEPVRLYQTIVLITTNQLVLADESGKQRVQTRKP